MTKTKSLFLVFCSLLLSLSCFFLTPVFAQESIADQAAIWADALQARNGRPRFSMMSPMMQQRFQEEQKGTSTTDSWYMSIGWSSPWVTDYTITINDTCAEIQYFLEDGGQDHYTMYEYILFAEDPATKQFQVVAQNTSDLFAYDTEQKTSEPLPVSFSYGDHTFFTEQTKTLLSTVTESLLNTEETLFLKNISFDNPTITENTVTIPVTAEFGVFPEQPSVTVTSEDETSVQAFHDYHTIPIEKTYTISITWDAVTKIPCSFTLTCS